MLEQKEADLVGIMMPILDERQRRIFLGSLSEYLGHGSVKDLQDLTGVSKVTIISGKKEARSFTKDPKARPKAADVSRPREKGAGRKSLKQVYPGIEDALNRLLDGYTVGNPQNPLLWTTKSLRNLQAALAEQDIKVSHVAIADLLEGMGYSLQQNKKYVEAGIQSPDRDEQFKFINSQVLSFMSDGQPVISVDTKKKELVGDYKNHGREYAPAHKPILVNDHDFPGKDGKVAPYGIYGIARNEGYVSVGISADNAEFAVNSIRTWWQEMGQERYPHARKLMITADGGGSNGSRNHLWKKCLQDFANDSGLEIHVSHFPPGTSKWNKIEHRMFAYISKNWRAKPLTSLAVIISLIAATTTKTGLKIKCGLDTSTYQTKIKVSDEEFSAVKLSKDDWHGEWNYTISPQRE